jgi:hypothetical protein
MALAAVLRAEARAESAEAFGNLRVRPWTTDAPPFEPAREAATWIAT